MVETTGNTTAENTASVTGTMSRTARAESEQYRRILGFRTDERDRDRGGGVDGVHGVSGVSAVRTVRETEFGDRTGHCADDCTEYSCDSPCRVGVHSDDRFGPGDVGGPPQRVRLAQLAAEAGGHAERPEPVSRPSPRHREPPGETPLARLVERWRPGLHGGTPARRRPATVVAAVAGVVLGVVTAMLIGSGPEPERAPPLPVARQSSVPNFPPSGARTPPSPTATSLVVSVVGKVAEPGLITVEPGARVADAVELAGGAKRGADLLTVNLARPVSDGEQIYVGVTPPPGASPEGKTNTSSVSTSDGAASSKVDLNSADQGLLETLPGVGEVTAARILEWRDSNGRFTSVEQLREIDGIGAKRFARLRDRVSVG